MGKGTSKSGSPRLMLMGSFATRTMSKILRTPDGLTPVTLCASDTCPFLWVPYTASITGRLLLKAGAALVFRVLPQGCRTDKNASRQGSRILVLHADPLQVLAEKRNLLIS